MRKALGLILTLFLVGCVGIEQLEFIKYWKTYDKGEGLIHEVKIINPGLTNEEFRTIIDECFVDDPTFISILANYIYNRKKEIKAVILVIKENHDKNTYR